MYHLGNVYDLQASLAGEFRERLCEGLGSDVGAERDRVTRRGARCWSARKRYGRAHRQRAQYPTHRSCDFR